MKILIAICCTIQILACQPHSVYQVADETKPNQPPSPVKNNDLDLKISNALSKKIDLLWEKHNLTSQTLKSLIAFPMHIATNLHKAEIISNDDMTRFANSSGGLAGEITFLADLLEIPPSERDVGLLGMAKERIVPRAVEVINKKAISRGQRFKVEIAEFNLIQLKIISRSKLAKLKNLEEKVDLLLDTYNSID